MSHRGRGLFMPSSDCHCELGGFTRHLAINGIARIHLLFSRVFEQVNLGLHDLHMSASKKTKAGDAKVEEMVGIAM